MTSRIRALADQIKANPVAMTTLAHAKAARPTAVYQTPRAQAEDAAYNRHRALRPSALPESRSDRRKRLAALLRDNRDILPDWTALCSMARARGFFPGKILDRDIIQTLKAIGHDYGILRDEEASAREFLKGDGTFADRDKHVNQPTQHYAPAAAAPASRPLPFSARWSDTRKKMEQMKPGEILHLPMSEKNNAHGSAIRLSEANKDRLWKDSRKGGELVVRCFSNGGLS